MRRYESRWKPYVPVAERQLKAAREMEKLSKKGQSVSPVVLEGRAIARTFWGTAWCDNLERYSDFSNRLPRGRTYVRNGSVVDLQVAEGEVSARVSGSSLYRVSVKVSAVPKARWASICADSSGGIDSLVELLQGRFSKGVMERLCQQTSGLFPAPSEIKFSCSCPDWASMCKHVAATLYGVGARLDERPELLFLLRQVDQQELVAQVDRGLPLSKQAPKDDKLLATDDLEALFGLELSGVSDAPPPATRRAETSRQAAGARPKRATAGSSAQNPAQEPAKRVTSRAVPAETAPKPVAKKPTKRSRPQPAREEAPRTPAPQPARRAKPAAVQASTDAKAPAKTRRAAPAAVQTSTEAAREKPTKRAKPRPTPAVTTEKRSTMLSARSAKQPTRSPKPATAVARPAAPLQTQPRKMSKR